MPPQVTAVIPLHNHREWVNEAIDSCASQDYRPLRLVVVDDGSTDRGFEEVAGRLYRPREAVLGPAAPRMVVGKLTNWQVDVMVLRFEQASGPSFARNQGIKAAWEGTELFAFLDSDDRYEPGKVRKSVERFLDAPEHTGVVYSDFDTLRPDGLRLRQYKEGFSRSRLLQECIVNCDSLVSRKALEVCGGFDPELRVCEDYDLWLRISERFLITHIPESLVTIRVGPHSSSATLPSETWKRCYGMVFTKAQQRANA